MSAQQQTSQLAYRRRAWRCPIGPSLAVLPFTNIGGDLEQDYFADGIVEEMITALSRMRSLLVIARKSSFTFKGRSVDVKEVGRELGVRPRAPGRVRKAPRRLRITAQLMMRQQAQPVGRQIRGHSRGCFDLQDR